MIKKTPKLLSEYREKKDLDEISLLSQNGEPQIFISKDPDYLIPNKISDDILFQYKANGTYSKIEEDKKNYSIPFPLISNITIYWCLVQTIN